MAAYVSIRIRVNNPTQLKPYQEVAPSIIKKYNGKIIVRGGEVITLEGPEENKRIVIIEFENIDKAKQFYNSEEYQAAIKLRKNVADFEIIAINGIE